MGVVVVAHAIDGAGGIVFELSVHLCMLCTCIHVGVYMPKRRHS